MSEPLPPARKTLPLTGTGFVLVALGPLVVLGLALAYGGVWVWLALGVMAGAVGALDLALGLAPPPEGREFPGSDLLLACIAGAVLMALPLIVREAATRGGVEALGLLLAGGLWFGQVGHPAAHELIHRPGRGLRLLGAAVYGLLLFGHHVSAHRLVHHRHVGTARDPNTARRGEGYYRFLLRAWPGSIRAGLAAERALRGSAGPYPAYALAALAGLATGGLVGGWAGVAAWAALGLHFGAQVLLSDYVQHYGLARSEGERVGVAQSWNAPHWVSSALMLNAPRHSDHHMHPARPYPTLRLEETAPVLPWPLPLACLVALWPPLWRRRMAAALRQLTKA